MNTQQSLSPSAQKTWGSSVVVPSLYEPIADAIGARQSGHVAPTLRSHHETGDVVDVVGPESIAGAEQHPQLTQEVGASARTEIGQRPPMGCLLPVEGGGAQQMAIPAQHLGFGPITHPSSMRPSTR